MDSENTIEFVDVDGDRNVFTLENGHLHGTMYGPVGNVKHPRRKVGFLQVDGNTLRWDGLYDTIEALQQVLQATLPPNHDGTLASVLELYHLAKARKSAKKARKKARK